MSCIQVFLCKEGTKLSPFVLRIDGTFAEFATDRSGAWVVVVDALGALVRVGRLLRVRVDLKATTIYFDRLHVVKWTSSIADVGLTLPQRQVARLRPEDLAVILARDGIASTDDIPPIQDAAYVRELLEAERDASE